MEQYSWGRRGVEGKKWRSEGCLLQGAQHFSWLTSGEGGDRWRGTFGEGGDRWRGTFGEEAMIGLLL